MSGPPIDSDALGTVRTFSCVDAEFTQPSEWPSLHNMSMRPRYTVHCSLRPPGGVVVRFALGAPRRRWLRPSRATRALIGEMWEGIGLKGAALVFGWAPPGPPVKYEPRGPKILEATDEAFVVNVLARTRSGLLLGDAPLSLERGYLARELATDDPRLVELARQTGVSKWTKADA